MPGNGRLLTNRDGYRQESGTVELTLRGRSGARVAWTAWGAWMDWREYFEDRAVAVQDPTPLEDAPLADGGPRDRARPAASAAATCSCTRAGTRARPWRRRSAAGLPRRRRPERARRLPDPVLPGRRTAATSTRRSQERAGRARVDAYRLPAVVLLDARLARGVRASAAAR